MPKETNETVDQNTKNFLTENEIKKFFEAAKKGRHGIRDYCLMLMAYRHGLRVSELIDIRLQDLDLETGRIYVRRLKGSLSTHQPIEGTELRAIRAWLRQRENYPNVSSNYLFLSERGMLTRQAINYVVEQISKRAKFIFKVNPHMLRHSTGFYLANKGNDTRLIQDYLGHKNITHTVRYTRTAAHRFEGLWR
jgi:type 1 fimbriae regulatory protein FimB